VALKFLVSCKFVRIDRFFGVLLIKIVHFYQWKLSRRKVFLGTFLLTLLYEDVSSVFLFVLKEFLELDLLFARFIVQQVGPIRITRFFLGGESSIELWKVAFCEFLEVYDQVSGFFVSFASSYPFKKFLETLVVFLLV